MKKIIYTFSLLFCFGIITQAQSELIIEPGAPGVINATIAGDTIAGGLRADPDRVYVLRKGFPYVLTGTVEFRDFHLRIKAEEGEGARPFIIVDSGADPVSQIFRTRGSASLTLDGVHISGKDILGGFNSRIIRINSDDSDININNCLLEDIGQAGIRVQGDNANLNFTNSIFRNMGNPFNPDNGRLIDNRGVPIDTLIFENCIIYNVTSRIYRNGGGSSIGYSKFNQNTIWGIGQRGITFDVIQDLDFTNNIFFNGAFLGGIEVPQDTTATLNYWIEIDTFDAAINTINFTNNNFHTDQEIIDAYPFTLASGEILSSWQDYVLNPALQAAIAAGGADTNISEDLNFDNPPVMPLQFITANGTDTTSGSEIPTAEPWDFSNLTVNADLSQLGTGSVTRYTQIHEFDYESTAASATAGTEGQAIGANMSLITSIPDIFVEHKILYYPNPVNNNLFIQNLEKIEFERVAIYNLVGQQVISHKAVNDQVLEVNTSQLNSGTYILSITNKDGFISSRKFIKK
jgi:hypothetical protein